MKRYVVSAFTAAAVVIGASLTASAQTSTTTTTTGGQATAETQIFPQETITGVPKQDFPTPPVTPIRYTLPMDIKVTKDASVTTNTPITDQYPSDLARWSELVSQCLKDKPMLVRVVDNQSVPFIVNKMEGKLKLNANDKPVCSVQ